MSNEATMSAPLLRALLFLTSYAPLPVVLAARIWSTDILGSLFLVALAVLLVALAARSFTLLAGSGTSELVIDEVQPQREAFTTYLLGYVLPFVLIDINDSSAVMGAAAFVVILGLATIRSNLVYLNPLLALAGYRLYSVSGLQMPGPKTPVHLLLLAREAHVAHGDRFVVGGEDADVRVAKKRTRA